MRPPPTGQEPLNAPFLNWAVAQGILKRQNGPLRPSRKRPIKVGKRPIKEGKRPISANGQFSGTPPRKRPIERSMMGQNPQNREKRVSGSKKLPFPITSEKGALSRKIPIFLVEPCREMGIFGLKVPFSGALGNGSFLTPKPSFPGLSGKCKGLMFLRV